MAGRRASDLGAFWGWFRRHDPTMVEALARTKKRPEPRAPADRAAAERRARYLLRRHLTARQDHDLTHSNYFTVYGSQSREPYRIFGRTRPVLGQNIHDRHGFKYGVGLESGAPFLADWTEHKHPPSDVMLAQKLLIETDERRFLKIACKSRAR